MQMTRVSSQQTIDAEPYPGDKALANEYAAAVPGATFSAGQVFVLPAHVESLKERGFSSDELSRIVAPRRTLARRKELRQYLSAAESDRVLRLQRVSDMADRVFASPEKAQRWLRKENRALDRARPIDLLMSETGAHMVEQELHRIDFGMLA
jgi:putative toxin-antitoxin system antitoxin component (TIGR02293 family)